MSTARWRLWSFWRETFHARKCRRGQGGWCWKILIRLKNVLGNHSTPSGQIRQISEAGHFVVSLETLVTEIFAANSRAREMIWCQIAWVRWSHIWKCVAGLLPWWRSASAASSRAPGSASGKTCCSSCHFTTWNMTTKHRSRSNKVIDLAIWAHFAVNLRVWNSAEWICSVQPLWCVLYFCAWIPVLKVSCFSAKVCVILQLLVIRRAWC